MRGYPRTESVLFAESPGEMFVFWFSDFHTNRLASMFQSHRPKIKIRHWDPMLTICLLLLDAPEVLKLNVIRGQYYHTQICISLLVHFKNTLYKFGSIVCLYFLIFECFIKLKMNHLIYCLHFFYFTSK